MGGRMTKAQQERFDQAVLKAINYRPGCATYVLRNMLSWPNDLHGFGYWSNLETSTVLRSCRRLERNGLIVQTTSIYTVMLCWSPAETTRRALAKESRDGRP